MPQEDNLLVGFLKVKNEIERNGNIYRAFQNLSEYCDDIFAVDDGSVDGTYEFLQSKLPQDHIIRVDPAEADFKRELEFKQQLIELIHANGPWKWIFWLDADEVLDASGTAGIRDLCRKHETSNVEAFSFHYLQLWRNSSWYRLDSDFNNGWFIKLWRYSPNLRFDIIPGTHHAQFPSQIAEAFRAGRVQPSKFECLHYGNWKSNLKYKSLQYANGLGGVERHLYFAHAEYALIDKTKFPPGAEYNPETEPKPEPFSADYTTKIVRMNNLTDLKDTFCITISSYNRAHTLPRTLDSILNQTYQNWVCFVVDDGSTDETKKVLDRYQELDPRFFYVQILDHKGGVAVNEIACDIASRTAEFWVRVGSDDWLEPVKLERDFKAFQEGYAALYGPFQAYNPYKQQKEEIGNRPEHDSVIIPAFEGGGFLFSWANFAVRSSILKQIKAKYKNYNPLELKNMDDVILNYRIAKICRWIWRGVFEDKFIINPSNDQIEQIRAAQEKMEIEAYWNKDEQGASGNMPVYIADRTLCTQLITKEKHF